MDFIQSMKPWLHDNDVRDQRQQECQKEHGKGQGCNKYEHCIYRACQLGDRVGAKDDDPLAVCSAPRNF